MSDFSAEFEKFTSRQNRDRDVSELEGLIRGIALDGVITPDEARTLSAWCERPRNYRTTFFLEARTRVAQAVYDGVLDEEERLDILHFCDQSKRPNPFYSVATADMQQLHGILAGIAADGRVSWDELVGLRDWTDRAENLKGTWPYDEIESLLSTVLSDGKIDDQEHTFLLAFTQGFLESTNGLVLESPFREDLVRNGVCAVQPEVAFDGRMFCVTGSSPRASRREIESVVARLGGKAHPRVVKDLDYLVVAADRSLSWAFSCYGRKVEQAMALRRSGARLTLVHESDFWDAAAEYGVPRPVAPVSGT